ncbi:hypothetical protein J2N67_005917 (plasmid) [Bacillus thuringiensis]|uniref:PIN domain-containing protein n=1 Tax=Bacillus thuringiensis TaxID=1428 RepID=UPI00208EFAA1|nr:PIN domain-containing protein [Bacillus thuringiensis]USP55668.1 hypothetical protein J2N67_005917 [Bacillus thuringiensis]
MHIFLDTNILFKDPFLLKNYNRQLIETIQRHNMVDDDDMEFLEDSGIDTEFVENDIKLYISQVVYEEAKNHYIKAITNKFKELQNISKDLCWYMESRNDVSFEFTKEQCINKFETYYNKLIEKKVLVVLEQPNDVVNKLVNRSVHRTPPFFNNEKNEFRDAIIWLTYADYANKSSLDQCYFITDNVKEFSQKADKDKIPVPLHPELLKDSNSFTMYRSIEGLIVKDEKFNEFIEEHNLVQSCLDSTEHQESKERTSKLEKLLENLDEDFVKEHINSQSGLNSSITNAASQYAQNSLDVEDVVKDPNWGGYVLPGSSWCDITDVEILDKEIIESEIIVSASVEFEFEIEVYLYNPGYDTRDEKFNYYNTESVTMQMPISFVYNLDEEITSFETDSPTLV